MKTVLVFEASPEKRDELENCVRSGLDRMGTRHVEFLYFNPLDVFTKPIPDTAHSAFFALEDMTDTEAARKFGQIRERIPLVFVSDSEQFAGEGWLCGARFYLKRPFTKAALDTALRKCEWR